MGDWREEKQDIYIDASESYKRLVEKGHTISWSKFDQFGKCPAKWFFSNYAVVKDAKQSVREDTLALPGVIIQKLFEVFINKRVYNRFGYTLPALVNWFKHNTEAIYEACVFPLDAQYDRVGDAQRYFQTTEGKHRKALMVNQWGLDPEINLPQPMFISKVAFDTQNGTREKFLQSLYNLYEPILSMFLDTGLSMDRMLSEVYVKHNLFDSIEISGQVDFINNLNGGGDLFGDIHKLTNYFALFDGKFNKSKHVNEDQVQFYATLLYLKYKRIPAYVSFIDWSKQKVISYEYNQNYLDVLKSGCLSLYKNKLALEKELEGFDLNSSIGVNIEDISCLKYIPSEGGCFFCDIRILCKARQEAQIFTQELLVKLRNRKSVEKYINSLEISEGENISDINL